MGIGIHESWHLLAAALVFLLFPAVSAQGTRVGFYAFSCPWAESIIRRTVRSHFQTDPSIAAGLLRMQFHDCFVRGCDASILIDGPSTERHAPGNVDLRGFEVIDGAKSILEATCPGIVSCADILTLATRDAVNLAGGPSWPVPTGRRDGFVSLASEVRFPSFTDSVDEQIRQFANFGLSVTDLVALLGAHTLGTTRCDFFSYRLYNFTDEGGPDPSLDGNLLRKLQQLCPQGGDGTRHVYLDMGTPMQFDTSFYSNLRRGMGVLESDQMLWSDWRTRRQIARYTGFGGWFFNPFFNSFNSHFSRAMVRMSNIGVLTGGSGEIRTVCSARNSYSS